MKVAVVGAGWAGAAAAWHLHRAGAQVTVYEASRHLGGRARSNFSPRLQQRVDNGQHILLGAYTATLALMQDIGIDPEQALRRDDLVIRSADLSFRLGVARLPAPLHLLVGMLQASGLSLGERWQLMRLCTQLQMRKWRVPLGLTVQQWLEQGKQSPRLIRLFWQPLCVAAMNTPIQIACAQLFANVLRDSLGAPRQASQSLIPLQGLSELWTQQALSLVDLQVGTRVQHLAVQPDGDYQIHNNSYQAVVLSAQAPHTARMLASLPKIEHSDTLLEQLQAMQHIPIATVYLHLAAPWHLPHPMWLLHDEPHSLQAGQWLFDHSCLHPTGNTSMLAVVISDAARLQELDKQTLIDAIIEQVRTQTQRWAKPMPKVEQAELIMEKRASFAATPGLLRPDNVSPWKNLYLAGDWTDTGYPGVLEGAVRSGLRAAELLLQQA